MSVRFGKILLGLSLLLGAADTSVAAPGSKLASLPPSSQAAQIVGDAKPITAWLEFCRREPAECAVAAGEPATVALTPRVWSTITSVNRSVNTRIKAVTDLEHWGVADKWDIPTDGMGDCEDFQLMKRKLLAEAGLSRRAMRMTVVIDETGEGHAVLTLRTDRGDYVLDNKTNDVLPWFDTGYVFIKRESQDRIGWVSLGGATSPTMTANR